LSALSLRKHQGHAEKKGSGYWKKRNAKKRTGDAGKSEGNAKKGDGKREGRREVREKVRGLEERKREGSEKRKRMLEKEGDAGKRKGCWHDQGKASCCVWHFLSHHLDALARIS
jgi:hypothetical protein